MRLAPIRRNQKLTYLLKLSGYRPRRSLGGLRGAPGSTSAAAASSAFSLLYAAISVLHSSIKWSSVTPGGEGACS